MIDTVTYPVYVAIDKYPYCMVVNVNSQVFDIKTVSGYRKQFLGISSNFNFAFKRDKVLDVSEYSPNFFGVKFNSKYLRVMGNNGQYGSVGAAYWANMQSKDKAGHVVTQSYDKLLQMAPTRAKKQFKKLAEGLVSVPVCEGVEFPAPAFHPSLFNDYLHIRAMMSEVKFEVLLRMGYTAFTDFQGDFINNSARALATAVGLYKAGLLNTTLIYPDVFFKVFRVDPLAPNQMMPNSWENTPAVKVDPEKGKYWETGMRNILSAYNKDSIELDFKQSYSWLPDAPLTRDWKDLDTILPDKTCMTRPYIDGFCVVVALDRKAITYLRVIFGNVGCIDIAWDLIPEKFHVNFKRCAAFPVCEELISGFGETIYCTNDERMGECVYPKITSRNIEYYGNFLRYILKCSEQYGRGASGI